MGAEMSARDLAVEMGYQRQATELSRLPQQARAAYVVGLMRRWIVSVRSRISPRALALLTDGMRTAEGVATRSTVERPELIQQARTALGSLAHEMEENVFLTHAVQTIYYGLEALTDADALPYLISNFYADLGTYAPASVSAFSGGDAYHQSSEEALLNWPPARREAEFQVCVLAALRGMSLSEHRWLAVIDECWTEPIFVW